MEASEEVEKCLKSLRELSSISDQLVTELKSARAKLKEANHRIDSLEEFITELCEIDEGEGGWDGTVRDIARRARNIMTAFKHEDQNGRL